MAYQNRTTMTPEKREARNRGIVAYYRDNYVSISDTAKQFGVSGGTVRDVINAAGIPLRWVPMNFTATAVGEKVGRWTVVSFANARGSVLNVRCDCGTEAVRKNVEIKNGTSFSCGCRRVTHGERAHLRHSKEYSAWLSMKQRCFTKNARFSPRYIERGITVCPEWVDDFEAFLQHVGRAPSKGHSIDRIDNNGNYEPGNVRWATKYEQGNNRENNVRVDLDGEVKTLAEWGRVAGLCPDTIAMRIKRGDTTKERVLRPSESHKRRK